MIRTSAIISPGTFPCTTAILQGSPFQVFQLAKEAGYDCVQLTIKGPGDYSVPELQELMQKYSLTISAMATGRIYTVDGLSMASEDEENRQLCLQRLMSLADISAQLGRPAIVIGAVRGLFRDASSPEIYYRQFDRSLRELTAYCEPLAVPVILEADDHLEADAFCDPQETLDYVRQIDSPVLFMYLDTMHLYNEHLDPAEIIRTFGRHSFSIDISGENRCAPMDSAMDFPAILQAIRESGFSGILTFEMPPSPPEENYIHSLRYIKDLLETGDGPLSPYL